MLEFIDKWGFRMVFPLILIMFLKTCSTNTRIEKVNKDLVVKMEKLNKDLVFKTQKLDSLINISNSIPFILKEDMIFLIKNCNKFYFMTCINYKISVLGGFVRKI